MGSGGGGRETSRADGDTKGSACDRLFGGGDFSGLAFGSLPLTSPLLVLTLELLRLKRPMVGWKARLYWGMEGQYCAVAKASRCLRPDTEVVDELLQGAG